LPEIPDPLTGSDERASDPRQAHGIHVSGNRLWPCVAHFGILRGPIPSTSPAETIAPTILDALRKLVERWAGAKSRERATWQLYLGELCTALGVEGPRPAGSGYEYEFPIKVINRDGVDGTNFVDLFKRDHFVLEARDKTAGRTDELMLRKTYGQARSYVTHLPGTTPPYLLILDVARTMMVWDRWEGGFGGFGAGRRIDLPHATHAAYNVERMRRAVSLLGAMISCSCAPATTPARLLATEAVASRVEPSATASAEAVATAAPVATAEPVATSEPVDPARPAKLGESLESGLYVFPDGFRVRVENVAGCDYDTSVPCFAGTWRARDVRKEGGDRSSGARGPRSSSATASRSAPALASPSASDDRQPCMRRS
jgi:restriction-modification enzyme MmeI-like protein